MQVDLSKVIGPVTKSITHISCVTTCNKETSRQLKYLKFKSGTHCLAFAEHNSFTLMC